MGRISFPQGKGSQLHNRRGFEKIGRAVPSHIDVSKSSENITLIDLDLREAYRDIFGEALEQYNSKQKRADRKIEDYHDHIQKSKNGEKLFYEDVVQWGDIKDFQNHPELRQKAKEALVQYATTFQERNPNLKLVGAYIHMDEASPHLHIDYVPVAHGYSRGLTTRNSLDKAMKEMGFKPENESKMNNATKIWKENERAYFGEICRGLGLEVEAERKSTRKSLSVDEYKEARDDMLGKIEQELEGRINALEGQIEALESKKALLLEKEKKEGLKRQIRAQKAEEKEKKLQQKEEKLQKQEKELERREKSLQTGISDHNQQIKSLQELPKGDRTLTGKIALQEQEFNKLVNSARKGILQEPELRESRRRNQELSKQYEELREKMPTIQERMELQLMKQENKELKAKNEKLETTLEKLRKMNLPEPAQKLIRNVLDSFSKVLQKRKEQEQGYSR